MNPARSAGPAIVSGDLRALWLYLLAPVLGTAAGALVYQFVCRGCRNSPLALAAVALPNSRPSGR
jgi:Major intrinsic protein